MNKTWLLAGTITLITSFIHLISGHFEMVVLLLNSELDLIPRATLYACWHMVTITLFFSSGLLFYIGVKPNNVASKQIATGLGIIYLCFSLLFIGLSTQYGFSTLPQWTLLLPIVLLSLY